MLRISISGAHSVGKSTLAKQLINHYSKQYKVAKIREVARQLIQSGFKMSQHITEYGIINYINQYLKLERTLTADILISDRSLIDLLAYIKANQAKKVRSEFISLVEEVVHLESQQYDLYIYIPIEIPFEEDGIRPTDLSYRELVDYRIREFLDGYRTNWILVKGSEKERLENSKLKIDKLMSTINND